MQDKRVSLWDIHMREFRVGETTYTMEKPPQRGATCIVYEAYKQEQIGDKKRPKRVLLKEFYPVLAIGNGVGITRQEDGWLQVPEYISDSEEYKRALNRFTKSFDTICELANADEGAEFLSVPTSLTKANGTWYMEELYDSGVTFETLFSGESGCFDFDQFLEVFCKCLRTVARLHKRGYYHLDLTPKNVSYTKSGNIKLFDTDTFLHKDELKNVSMFLQTKGYSAPELSYAKKDAPYLIGPWTDIYSLAQFICWYIYGRPLQQEEVEEQLGRMEEVIRNRFTAVPYLSRKGLFRLKVFLAENLSREPKRRKQAIMADEFLYAEWERTYPDEKGLIKSWEQTYVYDEMMLIRSFLCDKHGEPQDNFKESTKVVYGYDEELADLEHYFDGQECSMAAVALTGSDKSKREELARFYATLHRLDFSDIVEVHCDNFEGLIQKIDMHCGRVHICSDEARGIWMEYPPIENPHIDYPLFFIIFDDCEEDRISKKEAEELNRLINIVDRQVLIVGKYNRCQNRKKEFGGLNFVPTVDMDVRQDAGQDEQWNKGQDDRLFGDVLERIGQEPDFPKWTWQKTALKALLAVALFFGGQLLGGWLSEASELYIHYDSISCVDTFASPLKVTGIMAAHILGNGISMLGLWLGVYCCFDLVTPRGWTYFVRRYSRYFLIGWIAMTSLTIPGAFREFSFASLCDIFGFRHWQAIEKWVSVLQGPVILLFAGLMTLWFLGVLYQWEKHKKVMLIVSILLGILASAHIVLQTVGNCWELLLHGIIVCLAEWYVHKRYVSPY